MLAIIFKTWNKAKKKNSKRQKEVERNCSRPMSPFGRSGLSQVSHHLNDKNTVMSDLVHKIMICLLYITLN